jgi:hypothetical protein
MYQERMKTAAFVVCGLAAPSRRDHSGPVSDSRRSQETAFLNANPNRLLLDGRSHGAIVTGARLEEDLESFLHTS